MPLKLDLYKKKSQLWVFILKKLIISNFLTPYKKTF